MNAMATFSYFFLEAFFWGLKTGSNKGCSFIDWYQFIFIFIFIFIFTVKCHWPLDLCEDPRDVSTNLIFYIFYILHITLLANITWISSRQPPIIFAQIWVSPPIHIRPGYITSWARLLTLIQIVFSGHSFVLTYVQIP
jgi:hypothetical protein